MRFDNLLDGAAGVQCGRHGCEAQRRERPDGDGQVAERSSILGFVDVLCE